MPAIYRLSGTGQVSFDFAAARGALRQFAAHELDRLTLRIVLSATSPDGKGEEFVTTLSVTEVERLRYLVMDAPTTRIGFWTIFGTLVDAGFPVVIVYFIPFNLGIYYVQLSDGARLVKPSHN